MKSKFSEVWNWGFSNRLSTQTYKLGIVIKLLNNYNSNHRFVVVRLFSGGTVTAWTTEFLKVGDKVKYYSKTNIVRSLYYR